MRKEDCVRAFFIMFLCLFLYTGITVFAQGHQVATFVGGTGKESGFLLPTLTQGINGCFYVAGPTKSSDAPVPQTAFQSENNGKTDILLVRVSADLSDLTAATYLGGAEGDTLGRNSLIQCDSEGNVYIAIETRSVDFPVTQDSYDVTHNGNADIAIIKLDPALENILAATYLGGTDYEVAEDLRINSLGNIVLSGWTRSDDFPVTLNAFDKSYNGSGPYTWGGDFFVAVMNPDLDSLLSSTYVGGDSTDYGGAMVLDHEDNICLTGGSSSLDYPTTSMGFQPDHSGTSQGAGIDIVLTRLNADLTEIISSTFIGGTLDDWGYTVNLAPDNQVLVTGHTSSENFPITSGAYDTTFNGLSGMDTGDDVFIAVLTSDLSNLSAATYIGGTYWDCANWIGTDTNGDIYIAGQAASENFPVTAGAAQEIYSGGQNAWGGETFICRFNSNLSSCKASTFFGGSQDDGIGTALINDNNDVVLCGYTLSEDLPATSDGYDPSYNTGSGPASQGDLFLMAIDSDLQGDPNPTPTPTPTSVWYQLKMQDTELTPGDRFCLTRDCGNPENSNLSVDEYIILDVMSNYWFWPSWTESVNWDTWTLLPGENHADEIMAFDWPDVDGSLENIRFWGAFLESGGSELIIYTFIDWEYHS